MVAGPSSVGGNGQQPQKGGGGGGGGGGPRKQVIPQQDDNVIARPCCLGSWMAVFLGYPPHVYYQETENGIMQRVYRPCNS